MAALSYLQTAGASSQSAARRFWVNRFRMGGPRVPDSGLKTKPTNSYGFDNLYSVAPESDKPIAPTRPIYASQQQGGDQLDGFQGGEGEDDRDVGVDHGE